GQELVALLVDQTLPHLGRLSRHPQPALGCPADELAVEDEWLPRAAGRREVDIGGPMALVTGDGLHASAHPNPDWLGIHGLCNGDREVYVRIRAGTVNLKVVPRLSLAATQIRPPNERSTTSRHR